MSKTFYITTPIYYINDIPHIGHAYTTIAADILARFKRRQVEKVFYLTGTDEHGQKVAEAAEKKGLPPQEFVNSLVPHFEKAWKTLEISNDDFIRTTSPRHIKVVQEIFSKLLKQGDVYKGEYEGWYCSACETFWTETQLINRKCPNKECQRDVQKLKEESYFFKLSKYEKRLLDHIEKYPDFIQPESRRNEIVSFIKQGLKDLSISRTTFKWGVPIKEDAKHVIYVWFDALINYLSALGYSPLNNSFEKPYWPADVHIMGKEITRFHAVIWPAMLMALGVDLPKVIFGHGWWTVEGEKMSKTKGNVVDPIKLSEEFGVDAVRYFLLREVIFGNDGDFSLARFKQRYNTDLANDLGNLFSRSLNMFEKYLGEKRSELEKPYEISWTEKDVALTSAGKEIESLLNLLPIKIDQTMNKLAFSQALDAIWEIVNKTNKFIEIAAPWTLAKNNTAVALMNVLVILHRVLKICAQYVEPFMPHTAEKMKTQLKLLKKGEPLFPRIEIKK
ncbi:MAG: methionine--tRNA ligase [Candidatus Margulisbacteria bacterium]|nr:methionine--tRNA ligase [Candidatus Margulisiibacteriota bacterium]